MGELVLPIRSSSELALAGRLSSDERLARLVSRGSERAFAVLYQRHYQALYRYCLSIVRDESDAQDALQSAMTCALVALRAQERNLSVRPWLFRIAHNEAVSVLRRRRPTTALAEGLESADFSVERTLEGRERLAMLLADLQALPVRQRSALVMRELSGLSIEEIAGALSTSPGATKQVLFEARRALYDFAEGRAMECEQVRQAVSDGDRRVLRGRKLRGHLRECANCRDFQVAISTRGADLRALAPPLPGVVAAGVLGRLLAHGVSGGHTGGLAVSSGAAVGNSAAASLTVKALAGVTALTVALAGGTHLAFVHGTHGPSRVVVRQGTGPEPSGLATAGATTRLATSGSGAQLPVTRRAKGAGTAIVASPSATAAASVNDSVPSSAQTSIGPHAGAGKHSYTGYGLSHPLGQNGTRPRGHKGLHGSRADNTRSRRAGSSRPQHGPGGTHKQAPAQPVKPNLSHERSRGEPREPLPASIPGSSGARQEAAGAHTHAHGAPADTPPAGAGGEGRVSSTTVSEGARQS
ncbi:MAG TPA: sigma-70 family RNA polymerase sigma factor [Solirubrobacteraceae bacterium]|nr:sigma-70 family RNA polymerase sigma factor [Solirubrobacteraceae bacterium]